MNQKYTAVIRKSHQEYVAICMELNVSARGMDLFEVENNLKSAIEIYLHDLEDSPDTIVNPISTEEFLEFLRDTEPDGYQEFNQGMMLRPLELHEVRAYV